MSWHRTAGGYSPDGRWLYFNTEQFSGHAQLARVLVDGCTPERLRVYDTVDWFPDLSADGRGATFIAFPPGTAGHPADVWVDVMSVELTDRQDATVAYPIETGSRHD
jgi:Tol biopolymer transport system component